MAYYFPGAFIDTVMCYIVMSTHFDMCPINTYIVEGFQNIDKTTISPISRKSAAFFFREAQTPYFQVVTFNKLYL